MCRIQKNPYFQTRPDSQEDIKVIGRRIEIGLWKSFLKQVGGTYAPMKHKFDLNIEVDFMIMYHFPYFPPKKFPVDPWKFHGNFPHTGISLTTIQQK